MKTALALAALLAVSAPALAQEAGAPGATGVAGSLTGSNPGTGFYPNGPGPNGGYYGPGPYVEYGPGLRVYDDSGPYYGPGLLERRAAAPDVDGDDPFPRMAPGDRYGRDLER